jgi:hypothetical protein
MSEKKRKPGRPAGSGNKKGKKDNKELTVSGDKVASNPTSKILSKLKGDVKKLYKDFSSPHGHTLTELKSLASKMNADITLSETSHKNSWENKIVSAREALEELERTKKVSGKTASEEIQATRRRTLLKDLNSAYFIDTKITTLRGEYLKVLSEIDRIESGRSDNTLTIYQIMSGQGDPTQNARLEETMFELDEEDMEEEDYIEAEITETEEPIVEVEEKSDAESFMDITKNEEDE